MIDERLKEWATTRQIEIIDAVNRFGSGGKAAKELGICKSAVNGAVASVKRRAAAQGFSPDHDMTRTVPDGFMVKGVSTYYDEDGKPRAQWVKSAIDRDRMQEVMRETFAAMADELPREKPAVAPLATEPTLCNLYTFTDYHLGMLAWHREGGADWDLTIAERVLDSAFSRMVESAPKADYAIINIQGDFMHSDGLLPVTPAHKHVLDQDGRFAKVAAAAIRVLRRLVRRALQKHKRVHFNYLEGNHDEASSLWIKLLFAALFEEEPRLTHNLDVLPYHAILHGEVMLAFHHGHKVSNEQLPMLFAAQFPELWGKAKKRYAHTGHRHHTDEKEYAGMTVTQHPTLAARDAYAARGGWISERAATAITYHEKYGQVARTIVCPEMFEV